MGSTWSLDTGICELHTGPRHPLSGADSESYFDLIMVPLVCQPKGEGDCGYLAMYSQAYSGRMGLVSVGRLPTWERGNLIIGLQTGEAHQPCMASHLGDGN